MAPLVFSIITVTRNDIDGLRRTQVSVEAQRFGAIEWIVVDGASDDGTAAHLGTTAARWLSEPDLGIYDAMNKGLKLASGELVQFLNSGDCLAREDTLSRVADAAADVDLVYGDGREIFPGGRSIYRRARDQSSLWRGLFTRHQAMFYRRACIGTRTFDLRYPLAADYLMTASLLKEGARTSYIPRPLCDFQCGGVSQAMGATALAEIAAIRVELGLTGPGTSRLLRIAQYLAWRRRRVLGL